MAAGKHKEKLHGKVRLLGEERSEKGDAQDKARATKERQVRQDSQESKASDRHRPVEGAKKGGQGSAKEEEVIGPILERGPTGRSRARLYSARFLIASH
jgi:hypothetical protein